MSKGLTVKVFAEDGDGRSVLVSTEEVFDTRKLEEIAADAGLATEIIVESSSGKGPPARGKLVSRHR